MMGGANNMLGGKGATDFMKKWTKIIATLFFISSLMMAVAVKRSINKGPAKSKALKELKKERQNNSEAIPQQESTPVETTE